MRPLKRSLTVLVLCAVLPGCVVGIPIPGEPAPLAFGPARPMGMVVPSKPPIVQTDRNPLPVSLPERVGDRLVVEPVERSEKAAALFPWVRLAWNLGVFNPILGLLAPDFTFSGMGGWCW